MLLALPILLPLTTAITLQLLPQHPRLLRRVAFGGAICALASAVSMLLRVEAAGIQVLRVGSWPAPYGITLVSDLFSALLVTMVGIIGVAITASSFAGVDPRREALGYHPLIQVLLMGVSGAFLTGDIFNLYVWFEVMLIASFVLMSAVPHARSAACRLHVCRSQPAGVSAVADGDRSVVRPSGNAELRGSRAGLA